MSAKTRKKGSKPSSPVVDPLVKVYTQPEVSEALTARAKACFFATAYFAHRNAWMRIDMPSATHIRCLCRQGYPHHVDGILKQLQIKEAAVLIQLLDALKQIVSLLGLDNRDVVFAALKVFSLPLPPPPFSSYTQDGYMLE